MAASDAPQEQRSTQQDQTHVALTIYNDNLALIKDQRTIQIPQGAVALAFSDVSARMKPETAQFRALDTGAGLQVIEQNFDFDLLTPTKLLEKYVGRQVDVVRAHPVSGTESRETARVLSANSGVVLQFADRIETGVPGRITYPDIPGNLRAQPTLVMALTNQSDRKQNVELSYLSGGLSWKSDYVLELSTDESRADITGWVTLTNTSGTSYRNAQLQLVAGDVNQAPPDLRRRTPGAPMVAMAMATAGNPMTEESLLEYHLYTLARSTTIADNQSKQVSLLAASDVPTHKELVLQGSDYYYQSAAGDLGKKLKVGVFLEFENRQQNHLGMPLPKGVVRVYQRDAAGNAQFVGEDRIDHTARNASVRLKLGDAFDVTASKKQTDFKFGTESTKSGRAVESAYEIEISNGKRTPVTVTVVEPMPGEWKILSESQAHIKTSSSAARWSVQVPAEGVTRLTYRVVTRW